MKKIIINGSFLCRNLTGIERFALEICKRLDSLDKNNLFELYVPKDAKFIPESSNLKITISQSNLKKFPLWDHFTFPKYVKKSDGISYYVISSENKESYVLFITKFVGTY